MIYAAWFFFALSLLTVIGNWGGAIAAAKKSTSFSYIPLQSLLLASLAWLFGRDTLGLWAFLPTALDPGTWMLAALPGALLASARENGHRSQMMDRARLRHARRHGPRQVACDVCGKPGKLRHFPGHAPYTGIWCDWHYRRAMIFNPSGAIGCLLYPAIATLIAAWSLRRWLSG